MEEIRAKMSEIEEQRHQSYVKYPLADISIIVRMRFETEGEVVAVDGKSWQSSQRSANSQCLCDQQLSGSWKFAGTLAEKSAITFLAVIILPSS